MSKKTYVHNIIATISDDPPVGTAELLFSNKEQRQAWIDHWIEKGAPESVGVQLEALHAFGREAKGVTNAIRPISSPGDVITKLAREKRQYPSFHWVTWPLDANKQHMLDSSRQGVSHYMRIVTKLVPSVSDLPPVETGGGYILIFTGPPEAVLRTAGTVKALHSLCESENIMDVLFRKFAGNKRLTYSVKAGEGYYKAEDGSSNVAIFDDTINLSWFNNKGAAK